MTVFRLINPVDEAFKDDMDNATGIKRRIVAMKRTYTTSIHTICFVFPIFLGITDFESIFKQAKDQCDLEIEPYRLAVKLSANTRPGGSRSPRWSRCTPRP